MNPSNNSDLHNSHVLRHQRAIAGLPAMLWFLCIMVLLSLPGQSFPVVEIWKPDKIAHLLLFGMQFVLLWIALEIPVRREVLGCRPFLFSIIATLLFGILSEGYQAAFTTRMADVYDMIANAVGVGLALLLVYFFQPARILDFARIILRIRS